MIKARIHPMVGGGTYRIRASIIKPEPPPPLMINFPSPGWAQVAQPAVAHE